MAELAVALDEPCAGLLVLAGLEGLVGEGAGGACGAGADFEKFAGNMGEVLCWMGRASGDGEGMRGDAAGEGADVRFAEDLLCFPPLSFSPRSLSLSGPSPRAGSGSESFSLCLESAAGISSGFWRGKRG